jgi:hypothetical protein
MIQKTIGLWIIDEIIRLATEMIEISPIQNQQEGHLYIE